MGKLTIFMVISIVMLVITRGYQRHKMVIDTSALAIRLDPPVFHARISPGKLNAYPPVIKHGNGNFISDFPINIFIYKGFSITVIDYQRGSIDS